MHMIGEEGLVKEAGLSERNERWMWAIELKGGGCVASGGYVEGSDGWRDDPKA